MEKDFVVKLFGKAQNLHNEDNFIESNEILLSLLAQCKNAKQKESPLILIAGNYYKLKSYKFAIYYSKKALNINRNNELPSLMIYLSYVHLKEYNSAFEEIFRFLKSHKAGMYKDTLEELLTDVKSGSINDEDIIKTIQYYAKENGVKIDG